jgi:hypothetical protein
MRLALSLFSLCLTLAVSGCDMLGIESASALAAKRESEGKAIGGACRHAGRAIEDCYTLNRKADKGAMFAGWREMADYMRENKIEVVAPVLSAPGAPKAAKASAADEDGADPADAEDDPPAKGKVAKAH